MFCQRFFLKGGFEIHSLRDLFFGIFYVPVNYLLAGKFYSPRKFGKTVATARSFVELGYTNLISGFGLKLFSNHMVARTIFVVPW